MRRIAVVAAAGLLAGCSSTPSATPPVAESGAPAVRIPDGTLRLDARSRRPVEDPDVRWERAEARRLEPLLGACEAGAPATVAARQVALVDRTLWKAERVTVYRDARDARAVMARLRRCDRFEGADGAVTAWTVQPLSDVAEEALFVGSLTTRDGEAQPGAHRGVVARQGRAIVWLVDFGPGTRRTPRLEDVPRYPSYAQAGARRLAAAPWLRR